MIIVNRDIGFKRGSIYMSVLAIIGLMLFTLNNTTAEARGTPTSFADLVETLQPAVVNISTVQKVKARSRPRAPRMPEGSPFNEFFDKFKDGKGKGEPEERSVQSLGSGFFISADGLVVTNNHVIEDADEITVRTTDGTEYEAKLLGRAPEVDLALLKIESDDQVPFLKWADSNKSRVGDWVLAIGNPYALGGSVTAGIISGNNRDINAGQYDNYIQTDAPINKGNSGGPMFNMDGQVVGVNTLIFSPTGGNVGIGFAIPSNDASRVVAQLKEFGHTRRGWLGVTIQPMTKDMAEAKDLEKAIGAIISSVAPNSPAEKSGLLDGDVILWWGKTEIEDSRGLSRVVSQTKIGEPVKVTLIRDGEKMVIDVITGEYPDEERKDGKVEGDVDQGEVNENIVEGMMLSTITDDLRKRYRLPEDVTGVVIISLERRSDAVRRGIRPGYVITKVNSTTVNTPEAVADAINARKEAGKSSALLKVRIRDGSSVHLPLKFEKSDDK